MDVTGSSAVRRAVDGWSRDVGGGAPCNVLQEAGATGCTISGAGPTCVALCESREAGEAVAVAMEKTFKDAGNLVRLLSTRPLQRPHRADALCLWTAGVRLDTSEPTRPTGLSHCMTTPTMIDSIVAGERARPGFRIVPICAPSVSSLDHVTVSLHGIVSWNHCTYCYCIHATAMPMNVFRRANGQRSMLMGKGTRSHPRNWR
eukprot:scaffold565_cov358-Prasinococcus_capsulatus_cf.AAC.6